MNQNPFSLEFGVQPPEYIDRFREIEQVKQDFVSPEPTPHLYALLGPRGSGKTVMMNDLYDQFLQKKDWIVIDLNGKSDLLLQLASALDDKVKSGLKSIAAEFSFSFSFLSLTLKGKEKISSLPILLQRMFEVLSGHGIKVLVTIDDVANNEYMAVFAKQFQSLRGRKLPIFLVMTGLYSVFNRIQGQEGLTFLQRAPKIYLGPLNERAIAASYQNVLGVTKEKALTLARFTQGYAFAYQCLGYLLIKLDKKDLDEEVISRLDYYLEEGVYAKLFDELSDKERQIVSFLAHHGPSGNQVLIDAGILTKDTLSRYKAPMERKGVLEANKRGLFSLALPRFGEYVLSLE